MSRNRYSIAFAYPTSPNARTLGVYSTGGHYVQQATRRADGAWSPPFIATGTEGDVFQRADDPELLSLLAECQGRAS